MASSSSKQMFVVLLSGQIDTAHFPMIDNLYCKYSYVYGSDWEQITGLNEAISPRCERGRAHQPIVVGLALEATFTSTNPFRWPQLVVSCYGTDSFGNDVVRGYGATHLPTVPGTSQRRMAMFVPEASTSVQKFFGWITGKRAEFVDPRIVASSEGRQVTRVRSQGFMNITMNIVLKDFKKFGYDVLPSSLTTISEFPLPFFETIHSKPGGSKKPENEAMAQPLNEAQLPEPDNMTKLPPLKPLRPLPKPRRRTTPAKEQIVEEVEESEEKISEDDRRAGKY